MPCLRSPASSPAPRSRATVDAIAEWQLPNGMIPWFPGGHADPWNHVEAAMALALGGRRAEAERAYDWLADAAARPTARGTSTTSADSIEQDKLDANVIAYVATGVWHHWLLFGDRGFVEAMWPVVEPAIDFVLDLQTPAGRDPLGPPRRRHPVVVRPAHRLVEHLPQPALRHRPRRATSATSGPTGSSARPGWPTSSRPTPPATCPTPSPPSTAGPWTGTTRC